MNTVTLYRFEHPKTGTGPYQTRWQTGSYQWSDSLLAWSHNDFRRWPTPANDACSLSPPWDNAVCACTSLPALAFWFRDWTGHILAAGFALVAVTVLDRPETVSVGLSGRQAVYMPSAVISKKRLV